MTARDRKCKSSWWVAKGLLLFLRLIEQFLPRQHKLNVIGGLIPIFGYQMIMNIFYGQLVMSICCSPFISCFICTTEDTEKKKVENAKECILHPPATQAQNQAQCYKVVHLKSRGCSLLLWNLSNAWLTRSDPWESPWGLAAGVFEESTAAASGRDHMSLLPARADLSVVWSNLGLHSEHPNQDPSASFLFFSRHLPIPSTSHVSTGRSWKPNHTICIASGTLQRHGSLPYSGCS